MTKVQTILGLDYGFKRIGVAVGQTLTASARPLGIVQNYRNTINWQALDVLIKEWQPDVIVVGLPLHADGTASNSTNAAHAFSATLQTRYDRPVQTIDERLSSVEAAQRLSREDALDAVAAQVILETWLIETYPSMCL